MCEPHDAVHEIWLTSGRPSALTHMHLAQSAGVTAHRSANLAPAPQCCRPGARPTRPSGRMAAPPLPSVRSGGAASREPPREDVHSPWRSPSGGGRSRRSAQRRMRRGARRPDHPPPAVVARAVVATKLGARAQGRACATKGHGRHASAILGSQAARASRGREAWTRNVKGSWSHMHSKRSMRTHMRAYHHARRDATCRGRERDTEIHVEIREESQTEASLRMMSLVALGSLWYGA